MSGPTEPRPPESPGVSETPRRVRGRRRRALTRWTRRLLEVAAALVAAAVVAVFTVDLVDMARVFGVDLIELAEREGSRALERPLRIGDIEANITPGDFVVRDLVIEGREPGDVQFDEESGGKDWTESDLPEDIRDEAQLRRHDACEFAAEFDEEMLDLFVEDKPIPPEMLRNALRRGTLAMEITPVLCGSALKDKGVAFLLDSVIAFLPGPLDVPDVTGIDPDSDEPTSRRTADDEEMASLAFGSTTTYGELARRLGSSARAAGRANATNPLCIIVPCHRVIGSDGSLTGYAYGIDVKRRLLEHEGAIIQQALPV